MIKLVVRVGCGNARMLRLENLSTFEDAVLQDRVQDCCAFSGLGPNQAGVHTEEKGTRTGSVRERTEGRKRLPGRYTTRLLAETTAYKAARPDQLMFKNKRAPFHKPHPPD